MAKTPSTMLPLGTQLPAFKLPDSDGVVFDSAQQPSDAPWLVMFICNHCPFVKHIAEELARIGVEFKKHGLNIVAINSNDADAYPEDNVAAMRVEKQARGYTFPYLFDATQEVAKSFQAACTPDFYVFDRQRRLIYRGQMDGSRPGNNIKVDGADLRQALVAARAGKAAAVEQKPSIGCNIKWRKGNEPHYFK